MKTIRAKIITLVLICTIISIVVCGGLDQIGIISITNSDAKEIMSMECKNNAQEIDTTLERIAQSVDTLASLTEQSLTDLDEFKTNPEYVDAYTEQLRPIALEFAKNTKGALTYYIRYNPEFTEPTSGIFATKASKDADFEQLTPTDFSIYESDDLEHVGWYYVPVENGEATWMDPYFNSNINVYMISYVVPIYVDGVSVGVVGMDIDFEEITSMVESVQIYETGNAFVLNSENKILYHNNLEFGTALEEVNNGELAPLAEKLSDDANIGQELEYSWNGQKKLGYYQKLENGMKLVSVVPKTEVRGATRYIGKMMIIASVIAMAVAVVAAVLLSRGIVTPIKQVTQMVQQMAELNLCQDSRIEKLAARKDETGAMAQAVKTMNEQLLDIVKKLENTGIIVMENAEQLKDSSGSIGEMCSDSSATTQELAAAMQESSATAESVSQNIETINKNAQDIMQLSQNGEDDSQKILERAKTLSTTTMEATERTKAMYQQVRQETAVAIEKSKAVDRINELTHTIMEISSQTNLLALNASIEAARAGESGRGFAVVADEIGNLANQTQATVNDIDAIIKEVYEAVRSMSECLNSSTEFLENTVLLDYNEFQRVGEQYSDDAGNYKNNMQEIGEAVRALGSAINEITEAMEGISRMAEESAEGIYVIAEKTSEIVQKVTDEENLVVTNLDKAQMLGEIVGNFTIE